MSSGYRIFAAGVESAVNGVLKHVNLRAETLTGERKELGRLNRLKVAGHFTTPVFPVPRQFLEADIDFIFTALGTYRDRFEDLREPSRNDTGYSFSNIWFTSPDAEVLYSVVREYKPRRIVEVGSGHSTRVTRQAIIDGRLQCELISVDPSPRIEVAGFADVIYREPFEQMDVGQVTSLLGAGDILFIDSSHEVVTGNDVVFAFLKVMASLSPGVLIHIHDVFLPYDYPESWVIDHRREWAEQYLVQALLMGGDAFEVIWPGYYVQQTRPQLGLLLPWTAARTAQSMWLRVKRCTNTAGPND